MTSAKQLIEEEPEVEELHFADKGIQEKAAKLAKLLRHKDEIVSLQLLHKNSERSIGSETLL